VDDPTEADDPAKVDVITEVGEFSVGVDDQAGVDDPTEADDPAKVDVVTEVGEFSVGVDDQAGVDDPTEVDDTFRTLLWTTTSRSTLASPWPVQLSCTVSLYQG
jgi:hypothetical protein